MNILAVSGSPHKKGNTKYFLDRSLSCCREHGHKTEIIDLYDLNISDCKACYYCKSHDACIIEDDMQMVYQKIKDSDLIIIGTPIYFGVETGAMKSFYDRLYAFVDDNRNPRVSGKNVIVFTVSGAPQNVYKHVADRMAGIFESFFKFKNLGVFAFGGMGRKLTADKHPELYDKLESSIFSFIKNK